MIPPAPTDALPRDPAGYDLYLALRDPGCPICRLTLQAVDRYLTSTAYEDVTDPTVREQLRVAQGWCVVHAERWLAQPNVLGTALIYQDILTTAQQILLQAAPQPGAPAGWWGKLRAWVGQGRRPHRGQRLAAALAPTGRCPACAIMERSERQYVGAFTGALGAPAFLAAYQEHPTGVCLPHLRAVLRREPEPAQLAALVAAQAAQAARTSAALGEVIRKQDYRFRAEARGEEFGAPAQAVEQVAGRVPPTGEAPR